VEFNEYGDGARGTVEVWKIDGGQIVTDREEPVAAQPDADGDEFAACVEDYLGTDFLDNCPDGPTDDAWPLDIDMNGDLSVTGDVINYIGRIGATPSSPQWWGRLDFDTDSLLSVTGDVIFYIGRIGEKCT